MPLLPARPAADPSFLPGAPSLLAQCHDLRMTIQAMAASVDPMVQARASVTGRTVPIDLAGARAAVVAFSNALDAGRFDVPSEARVRVGVLMSTLGIAEEGGLDAVCRERDDDGGWRESPVHEALRRHAHRADRALQFEIADAIRRALRSGVASGASVPPAEDAAAGLTAREVVQLLADGGLAESEHRGRPLSEAALKGRVRRAKGNAVPKRLRSLDRMLVGARIGETWKFRPAPVRAWIKTRQRSVRAKERNVAAILAANSAHTGE